VSGRRGENKIVQLTFRVFLIPFFLADLFNNSSVLCHGLV